MSRIGDDDLRGLIAAATPGLRVQFHPFYCPEAKDAPLSEWDTSHDMSVILPDGSRYKLATYRHADDAALSQIAPALAAEVLQLRGLLHLDAAPVVDAVKQGDA